MILAFSYTNTTSSIWGEIKWAHCPSQIITYSSIGNQVLKWFVCSYKLRFYWAHKKQQQWEQQRRRRRSEETKQYTCICIYIFINKKKSLVFTCIVIVNAIEFFFFNFPPNYKIVSFFHSLLSLIWFENSFETEIYAL